MAAALGFVILMTANLLFAGSSGGDGLGFRSGALGVVFGIVGIILGCRFLALDFKQVEDGLAYGAPREEAWFAAFGLTLTPASGLPRVPAPHRDLSSNDAVGDDRLQQNDQ
ncbi:hypothetical protein SVIOM342S_02861 [Streptomyces violaceorubidus]